MKNSYWLGTSFALLFWSFSAESVPITYTLNDVVFDDGGTATGTFTFELDTLTYSDVSIVTTAGSQFAGKTYSYPLDEPGYLPLNSRSLWVKDSAAPVEVNDVVFNLVFTPLLTNDGGTYAVTDSSRYLSAEGNYIRLPDGSSAGAFVPFREISSGTVSGVPIPPALYLFGSGLLGVIGIARGKKA